MYTYLLFIHILSAITASVTIMGSPFIMSGVRTTGQAKFGLLLWPSCFPLASRSNLSCCSKRKGKLYLIVINKVADAQRGWKVLRI